ncbi:MAG: hypothetical protein U0841_12690 [Chloroflexia bacterium]
MKIADVRPVGFWDGRRNWLVIVVETDDGLIGLGEAGIGAHQAAITKSRPSSVAGGAGCDAD